MKAHKHADAIKAWADGAQIQYKCDISGWVNVICPLWEENSEYRVKPAAPKWPETTIHWTVLDQIFTPPSADERKDLIAVANAALRHACETGQVVTKEAHEAAIQQRDEQIEQLRETAQRKSSLIAELRSDREARDMAVAQAVAHAYLHAKYTIAGPDSISLAAIIAEVRP